LAEGNPPAVAGVARRPSSLPPSSDFGPTSRRDKSPVSGVWALNWHLERDFPIGTPGRSAVLADATIRHRGAMSLLAN